MKEVMKILDKVFLFTGLCEFVHVRYVVLCCLKCEVRCEVGTNLEMKKREKVRG